MNHAATTAAMPRLSRAPAPRLAAPGLILAAAAAAPLAPAAAQSWTAVSLHPAGAASSQAWSVRDGIQAGEANIGGTAGTFRRAGVWTGSAASWTNLHPPVATFSYILSTQGGQHVGAALVEGFSQASLWTSSSPAAWLSLHPAGADFSIGMGGGATQQVGRARFGVGTPISGILWTGSAASYVNLHPGGAVSETWAMAADGGQQVGSAAIGGTGRSSLWTGSAGSWMDMTPSTALASRLEAVHDGRQAGMIVPPSQQVHAAFWTGTPESAVDLNPAGTTDSWAYGIFADTQVGYASFGGQRQAAFWSGTAASFVNLHSALPAGVYSSSEARSVWHAPSGDIQVVGFARTVAAPSRNEAILWVLPAGPPACYANCDESTQAPVLNVQDFSCFLTRYAAGESYANCDGSTQPPVLNVQDFSCFLTKYAAGCP